MRTRHRTTASFVPLPLSLHLLESYAKGAGPWRTDEGEGDDLPLSEAINAPDCVAGVDGSIGVGVRALLRAPLSTEYHARAFSTVAPIAVVRLAARRNGGTATCDCVLIAWLTPAYQAEGDSSAYWEEISFYCHDMSFRLAPANSGAAVTTPRAGRKGSESQEAGKHLT